MHDDARRQGLRRERSLASPQFHDGVFRNTPSPTSVFKSPPLSVMGEFFFKRNNRVPKVTLPLERPHDVWTRPVDSGLRVTWLGHSTVLLEIDGHRILTDPVFGKRASPLGFAGPKRFHPVPASLEELPPLDLILLSHDHFDHLCRPTMRQIARLPALANVPVVTALGVGRHLERFGVDPARIHELDWHESFAHHGLHLTATPAQHFSGRGVSDRNKTLWASWVIASESHKIFFSGDTGLTPQFADIGNLYGPFDLVMLEVGAFHPSWGTIHLGPENALTAFDMLRGKSLLPVHWGTFNLALHAWNEPAETLVTLAEQRGTRVLTPKLGQPFEPAQLEGPLPLAPWWRRLGQVAELATPSPTPDLIRG